MSPADRPGVAREIEAFFEHYRAAFNAGDGAAVAGLWLSPSAITDTRDGAARLTWWADETPMRANMVALCGVYADVGPHHWNFEIRDLIAMGANHAFAHVAWTLRRGNQPDGECLQSFGTGYQLGRMPQGWRVLMCTAYQEDLSETRQHAAQ